MSNYATNCNGATGNFRAGRTTIKELVFARTVFVNRQTGWPRAMRKVQGPLIS